MNGGSFITNKRKQLFRDCPGNGWGSNCLCVLFLGKKGKLGNLRKMTGQSRDNPGTIRGQSREIFVYVFSHCRAGTNRFFLSPAKQGPF